ncbi:MAG: glycosyltransferase [Acidobacteria bacterium]|nr:glycosyltransferase [Acidobacteriota bacterium]
MMVACVSDVALGYGTPQLPLLVSSISEHYAASSIVLEPLQKECPPLHYRYPGFRITTIPTSEHPHGVKGRNEYVWRCIEFLNKIRPEVLLLSCTYSLPVLFGLKWRPRKVIYFAVESVSFYGEFDVLMNRHARELIDTVIFCEENRASQEIEAFAFQRKQIAVMYNCSNRSGIWPPPLPRDDRNERILYAGRIGPPTYCHYLADERLAGRPIDLFGPIILGGEEQTEAYRARLRGNVRHHGYLPAEELAVVRRNYIYSIVMWDPSWHRAQHYYAAPNKLFEAVADGVPPISAPHPQCELLIRRYGCGVVLPDWSFSGFQDSIRRSLEYWKNGRWDAMLHGCRTAVEQELSWDTQFAKLRPFLDLADR